MDASSSISRCSGELKEMERRSKEIHREGREREGGKKESTQCHMLTWIHTHIHTHERTSLC